MTVAAPGPILAEPPGPRPPTAAGGERWRWEARHRLAQVRDSLAEEPSSPYDGWLAARGGRMQRERAVLLRRLADLGRLALKQPEPVVRSELRRFLVDVERHLQRARDLQWDEVELELGGSD